MTRILLLIALAACAKKGVLGLNEECANTSECKSGLHCLNGRCAGDSCTTNGSCDGGSMLPPGATGPSDLAIPTVFSISAAPPSVRLVRGASQPVIVTIARQTGTVGDATLAIATLPTGVTASFDPMPATAGSSTLTLSASASAALGDVTVQVSGTIGTTAKTADVALSVVKVVNVHAQSFTMGLPVDTSTPTQGIHVQIDGQAAQQTDATGLASFDLKNDAYSLLALLPPDANGPAVYVRRYENLTLSDVYLNLGATGAIHTFNVNYAFSGAFSFTPTQRGGMIYTENSFGSGLTGATGFGSDIALQNVGGASGTVYGNVQALGIKSDPAAHAYAFGIKTVTLTESADYGAAAFTAGSNNSMPLTEATPVDYPLTVTFPGGTTGSVDLSANPDGTSATSVNLATYPNVSGAVTVRGFSFPGLTPSVHVSSGDISSGGASLTVLLPKTAPGSPIPITLSAAPTILSPASGSTGFTVGDTVSWTASAATVTLVSVVAGNVYFTCYTTATSCAVPNAGALDPQWGLPAATGAQIVVATLSPTTVADFVSTARAPLAYEVFYSIGYAPKSIGETYAGRIQTVVTK